MPRTQIKTCGAVLKMGERPPGVCLQGPASNRPVLLRSKGAVVSDRGKGAREGRQVSTKKMSANEPLQKHRQSLKGAVKTGGDPFPRDESEGNLLTDSDGSRCKGGMSLVQASIRNVGTWSLMLREMTSGRPPRGRIPRQRLRGGATRSSGEAAVIAVERRGGVIPLCTAVNSPMRRNR